MANNKVLEERIQSIERSMVSVVKTFIEIRLTPDNVWCLLKLMLNGFIQGLSFAKQGQLFKNLLDLFLPRKWRPSSFLTF